MILPLPPTGWPEQQRHAGRTRLVLRRQQPVQQPRKHDHHCLNQSLLVRQAGGGEGGGESGLRGRLLDVPAGQHIQPVPFSFVQQTEYARLEGGKCVYRIHRSPMCEYMINFIHKLKHLPEKYMMNSVLENFTILQVTYISNDGVTSGLKLKWKLLL